MVKRLLISMVVIFLTASFCTAQEYRATITGLVNDSSKAVIPNATVSVKNLETGEVLTVKTNAAGVYSIPFLHPGQKLEVTASAEGFKTTTYPPVVLSVSQVQTANFTLEIGAASQEITVNSQSYQVGLDTEKADRGAVIDNKTMTQMPLNGRNVLSLMDYLPGVTNEGGAGNEGPGMNVESTSYYTINGTEAQNTEYTVDGMPNNAVPWYLMNTPSVIPSVDALQEFKVTTSPYDAENGRTAAGVVSMELKSGTNSLHGAAYEFAKRAYLDANSWSNNYFGYPKSAHTEDQYGFEVDGPVFIPHVYNGRDKSFFMFNFEHFKQILPNFQTYDIPNAAWLQGDFSNFVDSTGALIPVFDPFTASTNNPTRQVFQDSAGQLNHIDPSRFNPIAVNAVTLMLNSAKPTTVPIAGTLPWEQIWVNTNSNTAHSTNYIVKFDQIIGTNDHLSGSWIRSYNPSFSPNTPPDVVWYNGGTYTEYHMNAGADWVHTFRSNLLMDLRFSYQRYHDSDGPTAANLNYDPTQLGIPASQLGSLKKGFPNINWNMQQQSAGTGNGYNNWLAMSRDYYSFPSDTYSVAPKITWIKGKHNIRSGVDIRFTHATNPLYADNTMSITTDGTSTSQFWDSNASVATNQLPTGTNWSSASSGNAVLDFLIGEPTGTGGVSVQNQIFPYYTWRYYAPWVQDDWKISTKLTLNLGFRYDLNGPPTARHGWLNTGFDINAVNPISNVVQGLGTLKGGITFPGNSGKNTGWDHDYTKWQPRVGFAWQALPGTVLRGGAGRTVLNSVDTPSATGYSYNPVYNSSSDGGRTYFPNNLTTPFPNGIPPIPGSSLGLLTNVGQGLSFVNPKYKLPSVINGSLGIEQAMPHDGKLEISYVMTRAQGLTSQSGIHTYNSAFNDNRALYMSCNDGLGTPSNPYPDEACVGQTANPFYQKPGVTGSLAQNQTTSFAQLARPYPQFTTITETLNNWGRSWYNGLQTTYQQRLGWEQINASWTWSKTMQSGGYRDIEYLIPMRTIAGTDRQNRITVTSVLYIPVGRGLKYLSGMGRTLDAAIGGWELGADGFWETGSPVGLNSGYNIVGDIRSHVPKHSTPYVIDEGVNPCTLQWSPGSEGSSTPGYYYLSTASGLSTANCGGRVAWQEVPKYGPTATQPYTDQIRGPGAGQIDTNLSKNFKFAERLTLQLRLEVFNVLNHPTWYGQVDMNPTDTNFGTVNKVLSYGQSNVPRSAQLGVKVLW